LILMQITYRKRARYPGRSAVSPSSSGVELTSGAGDICLACRRCGIPLLWLD
jgi:hypothetical protein